MNGKFNFYITVRNKKITEYHHEGDVYVEGRYGSEFSINLENNSFYPIKAVFSVDGLNIITGNTDFNQGYIIEPFSLLTIPGWKSDTYTARKFIFSSKSNSYNEHNLNGNPDNIGVIGVMLFESELKNPTKINWIEDELLSRRVSNGVNFKSYYPPISFSAAVDNTSCVTGAATTYQEIGTGFGDSIQFPTRISDKKFLTSPFETRMIYYDSRKGLERRGIKMKQEYSKPNPFPGFYCPPPLDKKIR